MSIINLDSEKFIKNCKGALQRSDVALKLQIDCSDNVESGSLLFRSMTRSSSQI